MITIRQTQLDTLDANARARFLDELTVLLHEAHTELNGPEADTASGPTPEDRQEVEILAQKAEGFGLNSHESIGVFLQAAFFIGDDFYDVFIPVKEVLRSRLLDEDTKRGWLEQWYRSVVETDEE